MDIRDAVNEGMRDMKRGVVPKSVREAVGKELGVPVAQVSGTSWDDKGNAPVRFNEKSLGQKGSEYRVITAFSRGDERSSEDLDLMAMGLLQESVRAMPVFEVGVIWMEESRKGSGNWTPVRCVVRSNSPMREIVEAWAQQAEEPLIVREFDTDTSMQASPMFGSGVSLQALIETMSNVILEGVSGTGKTYSLKQLAANGSFDEFDMVVFHPESSYQDFVEGLQPKAGEEGFEVVDGFFLEMCRRAAAEPSKKFLLAIDEINRANTARVLGDLLFAIEPENRVEPEVAGEILSGKAAPTGTTLPRLQLRRADGSRQVVAVPENLYLVGTMNTTDRSVGAFDLALRRRFAFHRLEPLTQEILRGELEADWSGHIEAWVKLNEVLRGVSVDALIGHSYFFQAEKLVSEGGALDPAQVLWAHLILPQVAEILVTFDALEKYDEINQAVSAESGFELRVDGDSSERFPLVAPCGASPLEAGSGDHQAGGEESVSGGEGTSG
jgi:hypothetical protein